MFKKTKITKSEGAWCEIWVCPSCGETKRKRECTNWLGAMWGTNSDANYSDDIKPKQDTYVCPKCGARGAHLLKSGRQIGVTTTTERKVVRYENDSDTKYHWEVK